MTQNNQNNQQDSNSKNYQDKDSKNNDFENIKFDQNQRKEANRGYDVDEDKQDRKTEGVNNKSAYDKQNEQGGSRAPGHTSAGEEGGDRSGYGEEQADKYRDASKTDSDSKQNR